MSGNPVIIFNHLSFSVQEGEVFGIIGPNGAGKRMNDIS